MNPIDENLDASRPDGPDRDDTTDATDARRRGRRRRRAVAAAAAVSLLLAGVAGVALAGEDDPEEPSSEPGQQAATSPEEIGVAFAECMRAEGIASWPDPRIDSDGSIFFDGLDSLAESRDEIDAARPACEPILDAVDRDGEEPPRGEHETVTPAVDGWERIEPGGDCRCADGSAFAFETLDASPTEVVLYLGGGGACWSAETCDPQGENEYHENVDASGPSGEGIFAVDDERNPLAGHSFVFVPYCTGDVHLGDATTEYGADLTVHHKGAVNGAAAVDHLVATYPDATEVVVVGNSAGAVSAPVYAATVADRLPGARVTVLADSGGAYADVPAIDTILAGDTWGATRRLPAWFDPAALTGPGLVTESARHRPDLVLARFDHAYDTVQAAVFEAAGAPVADLLATIDARDAQVRAAGTALATYTAPGDRHTILGSDDLYGQEVEGVALVDWVRGVVAGEPVSDVRCTDCTTASAAAG